MRVYVVMLLLLLGSPLGLATATEPVEEITEDMRCPVCGMVVAKYPHWQAQLRLSNGEREAFDGVKDLMAYYFTPQLFGLAEGVTITAVQVKDYYDGSWIDGRKAYYVVGSDVLGPMGHELIPFAEQAAAENFMKDHRGKELLEFAEIDAERIDAMRSGHRMKMKK